MVTILDKDMLTVKTAPKIIVPGSEYSKDTPYEGHAFLRLRLLEREATHITLFIRLRLCMSFAMRTSKEPTGGFKYGGR